MPMRLVRGWLFTFAICFCFEAGVCSNGVIFPSLNERKLDVNQCRFLSDQPIDEFDLSVRLIPRSSSSKYVTLLFSHQDERNYAFVDIGASSLHVGKVEEGLEFKLATISMPASAKGKPIDVLIRRRHLWTEAFVNGTRELVLSQSVLAMQPGHVGYLILEKATSVDSVSLQPVEEIYFADDFMRSEGEGSDWQAISGEWRVQASDNPLRSANAFTYFARARGKSKEAISVVGYPFWSNYSIQASLRCMDASSVGLILCWANQQNYYLFRWTGSDGRTPGRRELLECRNGKFTVLFNATGGFIPGQWYEVRAEVALNVMRVYIDGHKVCEVRNGSLHRGMAGLYTTSAVGAHFDDVLIRDAGEFTISFQDQAFDGIVRQVTGSWRFVNLQRFGRVCEVETSSDAKALIGGNISNCAVKVQASIANGVEDGASIGICLNYHDEMTYYLVRLVFGKETAIELVRYNSDGEKLLAHAPVKLDLTKPFVLSALSDGGLLTVYINGERVAQAFDASVTSGAIGLYASSCKARFYSLCICTDSHRLNQFNIAHEVFAHEYSMGNWAAAQSDWIEREGEVESRRVSVLWHRADFWGDLEVRAKVNLDLGMAMFILSSPQLDANLGYRLELVKGFARLFRNNKLVSECKHDSLSSPTHVRIRRIGKFVIAYMDNTPVLAYEDEQPLIGSKFGFVSLGSAVQREDVELFASNSINDMFRKAAVDWRSSNGLWEVSQRWQCDPRWSFFSGVSWNMVAAISESHKEIKRAKGERNLAGSNLAVVWSKYMCEGDMVVEFAVAVKMARERGSYSSYAQDLNITICADGKDLTSGYTFVLGGWRGTKSAIVRREKVVAQIEHKPFGEDIHRKWFLVRVEKRGGKLRYFVDDKLLLEYEDPQPIGGKHIAIWTRDNGIMIARLAICAERLLGKEEPHYVSVPVKFTFYDVEASPHSSVGNRHGRSR